MIPRTRLTRIVAAVVVTAVTLALIGAVVVSTSPLACGTASSLHIKVSSPQCQTVASIQSPSPSLPSNAPTPVPTPPPYPEPVSAAPYPQPVSGNPAQAPASYIPNPQQDSYYPYANPASIAFPFPPGTSARNSAIACALPIYTGGPGSGGFIEVPSGTFQPDPRSAVTVASAPGWWGLTYDGPYGRQWLPVPYRWVTPDGSRYAYPGPDGGIFLQGLDHPGDPPLLLGRGATWSIVDVTADGVYAVTGSTGGLWLLSFGGSITTITTSGYWQAVWGRLAFGTMTPSVPSGSGNTIVELDFRSLSMTEFFSRPSQTSSVVAFGPDGRPVIYVQTPTGLQIWTGFYPPFTEIADLSTSGFKPSGNPIVDSYGLWLSGPSGTALHVTEPRWYWMSDNGGQLAGRCS
jgi:hypothetical protein